MSNDIIHSKSFKNLATASWTIFFHKIPPMSASEKSISFYIVHFHLSYLPSFVLFAQAVQIIYWKVYLSLGVLLWFSIDANRYCCARHSNCCEQQLEYMISEEHSQTTVC